MIDRGPKLFFEMSSGKSLSSFSKLFFLLSFSIVFFLLSTSNLQAKKYTVSGLVLDSASKEPIIGCLVLNSVNFQDASTNSMGFFSLSVDSGACDLIISFFGYKSFEQKFILRSDQYLQILLIPNIQGIDTIKISRKGFKKESENVQMSTMNIPIKQIQATPSILGESDPLKIAQMLPGVQSAGEATPGLFVRGSASDQNLVLIDDAPVYNPFHLFGIFSVVNSDALKNFEITKGGYSSQYGGRLASVVNMDLKEGNKNKFSGDISLGLASSKALLEIPLVKDKVSLMVSGRASSAQLFAKPFMPKDRYGSYNFYDFNTKLSAELTPKTKLYFSAMYSGDHFDLTDERSYAKKYYDNVNWNNLGSSLRINHIITNKLFWNASLIYSKYNLTTGIKEIIAQDSYNLQYKTNIEDIGLKNDFTYYFNSSNTVKFGAITTHKTFIPDAIVAKNQEVSELERTVKKYSVFESAVYLENEFKLTKKIGGRIGGRINMYNYQNTTYINPEPRISLAYNFIKNWALKSSYTQMHQYMHLLTTRGIGLPTDLWVPATDKVPFKVADQITFGLVKDLPGQKLNIALEGYYKRTLNDLSFKEGTSFMQATNPNVISNSDLSWENNVTSGTSWAYGAELLVQKKSGKLQGWIGYTLSWSLSQYNELNFGKPFYNNYDRRNSFNIVAIYQLTEKIALTASWVYMTGNPVTIANSTFFNSYNAFSYDYSSMNNFRMPAYHRLDAGVNYKMKGKKVSKELEFSIYNVYNRQNPFFYYVLAGTVAGTGTSPIVNQVSILPILPSFKYKITF
jgi:hypothetical protein